jgi:hypothetical protein
MLAVVAVKVFVAEHINRSIIIVLLLLLLL